MKSRLLHTLFVSFLVGFVCSCTTPRKNTASTRWLMGVNTRYNVYFNAKQAYKEALASMECAPIVDYVSLLDLHPVDELARLQTTHGAFDRAIEKSRKAIVTRSFKIKPRRTRARMRDPKFRAFLQQEEYNPFLHHAWMLLARSQYYQGDFMNSLATYVYITRHFTHQPATVAEAQIGMAQNYVALGWRYEAEDVIRQIDLGPPLSESLQAQSALVRAKLKVVEDRPEEAIPFLRAALRGNYSKHQRVRLHFALGQLYQQVGNPIAAYDLFSQVVRMNPTAETEFNARIKQTETYPGGDTRRMFAHLQRMQRNARNRPYLDQVFYAMGNVKMMELDTLTATRYYRMAIDTSQAGGHNRALPQIAFADISFVRKNFREAQPAYSDAATQLPAAHKDRARVERRAAVLDELIVFAQNVELQDSLQRLVRMEETDRMAVIYRLIDEVKRTEEQELVLAARPRLEEERQRNVVQMELKVPSIAPPTLNTGDNSWYFYNAALLAFGKTEFQRKWGSRRLEDNWRRRNRTQLASIDPPLAADVRFEELNGDATLGDAAEDTVEVVDDPKDPRYYLAQLPFTPEALAASDEVIAEGLFAMAGIYMEKMQEFDLALATYNDLLRRFPETKWRYDVYYNRFLVGYRLNDAMLMEANKKLLIQHFPDSKHALALAYPDYLRRLTQSGLVEEERYMEVYETYLRGDMAAVEAACARFAADFPMSKILPKTLFLRALSYVPAGRTGEFKQALSQLIAEFPSSDVASPSSDMLRLLAAGGRLAEGGTSPRSMTWRTALIGDSASVAFASLAESALPPFTANADTAHLLLVAYPPGAVHANQLLYDMAAYNFTTFLTLGLDLETRSFEHVGMVLVRGFESLGEVLEYKRLIGAPDALMRKLPPEVQLIPISASNFELLTLGRSLNDYLQFLGEVLSNP